MLLFSRMKSAPELRRPKDEAIETLRGLAVVLVVIGHVIGVDAGGGMKVEDNSVWRYLYASLQYVRMPLFTAISGWVYAYYPVGRIDAGVFMLKKVRRLLLPMVFVGTLYFLLQHATPGTNGGGNDLSDIWKIYVFPFTVYWYLPSLFLIFGFVALLDSYGRCNTLWAWIGWLVLSCVMIIPEQGLSSTLPNVFSIWGAVCLLPYFLLGIGIRRFSRELTSRSMKNFYLAGFVAGIVLQQVVWFVYGETSLLRDLMLNIPIGILASAFLLTHPWRNKVFVWLGHYAYGIYLFHVFGTAAGRIFMKVLGVHSSLVVFGCSLFLGLLVPIGVEFVLRYVPLLQTLFLGKKLRLARKDEIKEATL